MSTVAITVDGAAMTLTPKEARAVFEALQECRIAGKGERSHERTKERDLLAYDLHVQGHSDASIGRLMGRTARAVRAAVGRVESGRYGRASLR